MKGLARAAAAVTRIGCAAAVAGLGSLLPARAAEGDSFVCAVEVSGKFDGLIPEMVAFVVGSNDGGTLVYDPFVAHYYGEPIEAQLLADTEARVAIRWEVTGVAQGQVATQSLVYELSYRKAQDTARVKAKAAYGDTLEPSFAASCKPEAWK